jgi:caffeoyl-CoA O-methyltransferase
LDSRIRRVISRLDEQSNRERRGEADVAPGQEMLAITADTGAFFSILLKAIRAKSVLEIGTSAGFSTLWFAEAVMSNTKKGRIVTIEANSKKVERASRNFQQASVGRLIEIIEGFALDVLPKLRGRSKFDFVFIDADKENIIEYFDLALPIVQVGGIIAADNMLYPEHYRSDMERYARYVRCKSNVQSVTVPIGMGEELTIRLR